MKTCLVSGGLLGIPWLWSSPIMVTALGSGTLGLPGFVALGQTRHARVPCHRAGSLGHPDGAGTLSLGSWLWSREPRSREGSQEVQF